MNPLLPPTGYSAPLPPPGGYAHPAGRGARGRGAPGYRGRGGGRHALPLRQQLQQEQEHQHLVSQTALLAERQVAAALGSPSTAATAPEVSELVRQAVAAALAEHGRHQPSGRGRGGYGARGNHGSRRGHNAWSRATDCRPSRQSAHPASRSDGAPVMTFDLDTPEKIERWRAERRKNYPTDANILRKKQEAVLQKRGRAGDIEDGGAFVGTGKRSRVNGAELEEASEVPTTIVGLVANYGSESDTDSGDGNARLQQEAEIQEVKGESGGEDKTDDEEDEDAGQPEVEPVSVSRAGGNNAKDDEGVEDEWGGQRQCGRRKRLPCKYFMWGRCAKGDRCDFLHDPALRKPKRRNEPSKVPQGVKRRPNLLSRLIAREVHAEKSAILQCLRFIVRNKFLDGPIRVWEVASGSRQKLLDDVGDDDDDYDDDDDEGGSAQSD